MPIEWKELYAIVIACEAWGYHCSGKRIMFHCDNQAIVQVWESGLSRSTDLMHLVSSLLTILFYCDIRGINNSIADSLSRQQLSRFWSLVPHADLAGTPIPAKLTFLTAQLTKLQALGVAASTRCTYQSGIKIYLDLSTEYKISPLPASETILRYFCAHLSASTFYPTIKVYLAGIRLLHIDNGFADPTKEAPLLHYLYTAIRHSQTTPPKKRQPILYHS